MHTTLVRMKCAGKQMHEYVVKWESCPAQVAPMDALMDNELLVTMFTEFFGCCSKSPCAVALPVLLTKEEMTWQALKVQFQQ